MNPVDRKTFAVDRVLVFVSALMFVLSAFLKRFLLIVRFSVVSSVGLIAVAMGILATVHDMTTRLDQLSPT
jgi:uncharacterized membrane protein YfhO